MAYMLLTSYVSVLVGQMRNIIPSDTMIWFASSIRWNAVSISPAENGLVLVSLTATVTRDTARLWECSDENTAYRADRNSCNLATQKQSTVNRLHTLTIKFRKYFSIPYLDPHSIFVPFWSELLCRHGCVTSYS